MTAMIDIDDFLPEALRWAPNTSDPVAYRAIINAAREVCERGRIWREPDQMTVTAPACQSVCTIADADIVSIEAAFLDDRQLEPVTVPWLNKNHPRWNLEGNAASSAQYVTQIEPNTLTIYPQVSGQLTLQLVLKPSRNALNLPRFLLSEYFELIGRGAASAILTDPNSPNPNLGQAHRQWFEKELDNFATKAARGQQRARLRTRGAYF
jgi:hypothetical protein